MSPDRLPQEAEALTSVHAPLNTDHRFPSDSQMQRLRADHDELARRTYQRIGGGGRSTLAGRLARAMGVLFELVAVALVLVVLVALVMGKGPTT